MNKKIEELAEQAANELADLFSPGFVNDRMVNDVAEINKKFAELILLDVRLLISDERIENDNPLVDDALVSLLIGIEKHFGVTE